MDIIRNNAFTGVQASISVAVVAVVLFTRRTSDTDDEAGGSGGNVRALSRRYQRIINESLRRQVVDHNIIILWGMQTRRQRGAFI